jgi:methylglutaconyl-CoA hydratase
MDINQQYQHIRCDIDHRGVATLTLCRPDKRNAFDDKMVTELTSALRLFSDHPGARVLLLQAEGKHFSAGADLAWMKRMADADRQQNLEDAGLLAELMRTLDQLPIPTVATVQGAVYGGALGLISCCDMVLADSDTNFCLSADRRSVLRAQSPENGPGSRDLSGPGTFHLC